MLIPTLRGKPGKLHKIAFQIHYHYGHVYLDRCGRTINVILQTAPEWLTSETNVQGATLVSVSNGCNFSFNSAALSLSIEQSIDLGISNEDVSRFEDQVDLLSKIVIDQLNLADFSRISLRLWLTYPGRDKADAERWLKGLGLFDVSDGLLKAFGTEIESTTSTVVIVGDDRKYRIHLGSAEKQAQIDRGAVPIGIRASTLSRDQDKVYKQQLLQRRSNLSQPLHAALIDIDAYQEDPVSVEPRDFVKTSLDQALRRLKGSIPST
jgi:hypothetical protein